MCGINGIIQLHQSATIDLEALVRTMNQTLAHRGPDDQGIYTHQNIALGHRRLSIIDTSKAGHQPMSISNGRYTIVYNGELYNYLELKTQIQAASVASQVPIHFSTNTDTEVLLAAYATWGENCLQRLNGMYAFALYDKQENSLFIARDRLGIKPLYYTHNPEYFIFSSELRPILKTRLIPAQLDQLALIDYLRYHTVHAPNTIISNVKMLMPGTYATIKLNAFQFNPKRYFDLCPTPANPAPANHAIADNAPANNASNNQHALPPKQKVKELFTSAVQKRLVADVPFGAFLSGGIDSTAIVATMSKVLGHKVKTFTVSFDETQYSEEKFAAKIAEQFHTQHTTIKLSIDQFKSQIPSALSAMDHPTGDGINTYMVSKATKEAGISMALSGLGGDELFAGYDIFKRTHNLLQGHPISKLLTTMPHALRRTAANALQIFSKTVASDKMSELLRQNKINLEAIYPISRQVLSEGQINAALKTHLLTIPNNVQQLSQQTYHADYLLSAISVLEISTYMQNVLLRDADQMSMASALEVRVPFLDYQLVEYVLSLPDTIKYPVTPKKLFVEAMGDLLPADCVNRKKMGFNFPWAVWMRTDLKSFCQDRIVALSQRTLFSEKEILQLWKRFLDGDQRITWSRIWHLVVLENWLTENQVQTN